MFKQPLKLLLLWLLPFIASANHVHWLGNYDTALQKAHQEHKMLLVLVVKKDSSLCNTIIKERFMDQTYIDQINQKTVPVIVTYEGVSNYPVELYYTTVFPALFFVDSKTEMFMKEPLHGNKITNKVLAEIITNL